MRLALTQPYLLPYIGYFQLIDAADVFICHDDVQYIKGGWINRNRILVEGQPKYFTVPVKKFKSTDRINEIQIADVDYRKEIVNQVKGAYAHPRLSLDEINFSLWSPSPLLADLCYSTILDVTHWLDIGTGIVRSSEGILNRSLKCQDAVIDICKKMGATEYVNPIGGRSLYSSEAFAAEGIKLQFIERRDSLSGLSILHELLTRPIEEVREAVKQYELTD